MNKWKRHDLTRTWDFMNFLIAEEIAFEYNRGNIYITGENIRISFDSPEDPDYRDGMAYVRDGGICEYMSETDLRDLVIRRCNN